MPLPPDNDLYIDTQNALIELVEQHLASTPWIAIDTEFIRERSYQARLCLIQFATPERVGCIDPLSLSDLTPLREVFRNPHITKVLHACHQDLEILYQVFGEVPTPVFDTQIAAALLGQGEQIGYGRLVSEVLGVELDKNHARTDWAQRPLEPAQIRYAADDVRYLGEIYLRQKETLKARGRLSWLDEDFARLSDPASYIIDPMSQWKRLRGIQRLQGVSLCAAQELAAWREIQASKADRPRKWILPDDPLLDIARRMPETPDQLGRIRGLPSKTLEKHGKVLLECVQRARSRPPAECPQPSRRPILNPHQEALADMLMAALRIEAERHDIGVAMLATRREIERLAYGEDDLPILRGWRKRLAGETLCALRRGERALRYREGRIEIE